LVLAGGGGQHLCDERRQGVGRVPVKGMSRAVVAAGSTRVGVAGSILDIAQRDPSVQRECHHRVPRLCAG
jgi:hypothetical protein